MTVQYVLTSDDYVAAALAPGIHRHRLPGPYSARPEDAAARRAGCLGLIGAWLWLGGSVLIFASSAYLSVAMSLACIAPALVGLLFTGLLLRFYVFREHTLRRRLAPLDQQVNEARFEIDEAGFHFLGETMQCHVEWSALRDLFETPALFVLIDDTPEVFPVPKRAFGSAQAEEAFRRVVGARVGDGRAG
jgi:hypothetical protein